MNNILQDSRELIQISIILQQ